MRVLSFQVTCCAFLAALSETGSSADFCRQFDSSAARSTQGAIRKREQGVETFQNADGSSRTNT